MTDTDTSPEAVERLSPYAIDGGCDTYGDMEYDPHGGYVRYEDYAALSAERDEALNQLDSSRHSVDVLESRVAKLKAELDEAVELISVSLKAVNWSFAAGSEERENGSARRQGKLLDQIRPFETDARAIIARHQKETDT